MLTLAPCSRILRQNRCSRTPCHVFSSKIEHKKNPCRSSLSHLWHHSSHWQGWQPKANDRVLRAHQIPATCIAVDQMVRSIYPAVKVGMGGANATWCFLFEKDASTVHVSVAAFHTLHELAGFSFLVLVVNEGIITTRRVIQQFAPSVEDMYKARRSPRFQNGNFKLQSIQYYTHLRSTPQEPITCFAQSFRWTHWNHYHLSGLSSSYSFRSQSFVSIKTTATISPPPPSLPPYLIDSGFWNGSEQHIIN